MVCEDVCSIVLNIAKRLQSLESDYSDNDSAETYEYISEHYWVFGEEFALNQLLPKQADYWHDAKHSHEIAVLNNILGERLLDMGYFGMAADRFERVYEAYPKWKSHLGDDFFIGTCLHLGDMCFQMGEYAFATQYYKKVIKKSGKIKPMDVSKSEVSALTGLSLAETGQHSKAIAYINKASDLLNVLRTQGKISVDDFHKTTFQILIAEGIAQHAASNFDEAKKLFLRAADILRSYDISSHYAACSNLYWLGVSAAAAMDSALALEYFEQAIDTAKKHITKDHPLLADIFYAMADVYWEIGNNADAIRAIP